MTTIKLKNGSGAPTAGDLAQGEPALDLTNKRLYTEDSGGTVIEVGTNPTSITTGAITSTGIDVTGTVTADGLTVDGDGTLQTSDGAILSIGTTDTSATTGDVIGQVTFANADASPNKANAEIRGMANDAFGRTNIDFRTGNSGTLNTRALISWDGDISFYEDTGTTAKLFWDASAESLGIGTTSPDGGIDIAQAQNTTNQFTSPHLALTATSTTDTTGFTGISYASSSVANYGWTVGALRNTTGNNSDFVFNLHNNSASGSEKMRIDGATGNVGIGTSSVDSLLHLSSSSGPELRIENTDTALTEGQVVGSLVFEQNDSTSGGVGISGRIQMRSADRPDTGTYFGTAADMDFLVSGASSGAASDGATKTAMTIRAGTGNVGIGTDSPSATGLHISQNNANAELTLQRTGTFTGNFKIYSGGGSTNRLVFRDMDASSDRVTIDSSGNLLVGTTSTTADEGGIVARPDSDVSNIYIGHATGTAGGNPYIRFRYGSGNIGSITQSGTTAVLYNTSSDQRLKDNIVDAPSASDDIDAIQVRSFDWKADGSHQKYGMVAQELQSVAPEAVSVGETEEDMMGVDYSKLVPMMMKEIQSLRARVAQLEGAN